MSIEPLLDARSELTHASKQPGPVVLSTRIRLARNLRQFPFPGWADKKQRHKVFDQCCEAIARLKVMQRGTVLSIRQLADLERRVLVERHLISRELSDASAGAGVIVSRDQACSIMVNEEDHLRIQVMRSGFHLRRAWRSIDAVDTVLEQSLDYAFSEDFGYLTACPTNLGTGLRASVMLHLPGLVLARHMEQVVRAVNQIGMAVRGIYGEGSEALGSIFQISNQQTLGESESDILRRLSKVLSHVIEQEENARYKFLESNRYRMQDEIGRAYGTLKHAWVLNSAEAMNHLSLIRLAIDFGMLEEKYRMLIDRLVIQSQPGHVRLVAAEATDSDRRDVARAAYIREEMAKVPPLNLAEVE